MALLSSFNEDRPVTYFRGYPIYYATILTVAYAVGVLATFSRKPFGGWEAIVSLLAFDSAHSIFGGQIWQIFTYSFVDVPSFFTIIGLLFLYVSAVEIEKYIGKARFLTLYGVIVLIPVVSLTAVWDDHQFSNPFLRPDADHDWSFHRLLHFVSRSSMGWFPDRKMGCDRQPGVVFGD